MWKRQVWLLNSAQTDTHTHVASLRFFSYKTIMSAYVSSHQSNYSFVLKQGKSKPAFLAWRKTSELF